MRIEQRGRVDAPLAAWNDDMYRKHPTPYAGIAGLVERARARKVLRLAAIRPSDAVLELGCESGNLLVQVSVARRLVGSDISRAALEDATKLFAHRHRTAEFVQLDAQQELPFTPGEFDVILSSEMLEHVEKPRAVLENLHRICTPETRVVISIPIEKPKLVVKKVLGKLRLFHLFFPGIEEERSEWHLQLFSKRMLLEITRDLFHHEAGGIVGTHYVGRFRRKT
jgi:2-polyprenyl-3-methyl-5-hydroxy-6-metoxy-1,4-benzoquinol methylase